MYIERKDAPAEYRWDLTVIYATEEDFEAELAAVCKRVAAFPARRAALTESAEGLFGVLEEDTAITRILSRLYTYAMLLSDLDKGDNAAGARLGRVRDAENEYGAASYFITPDLLALDGARLAGFFEEYAPLRSYRRPIEWARRMLPHMMSDESERLLASLAPALGSHNEIQSVFSNADLAFGTVKGEDGEPVELTNATYVPLLMSKSRRVRRSAFLTLYRTYRQFANTLSALLAARIKERVTLATLRRFDSTLHAATFGDEVDAEVYHNLIRTVREGLSPLFDYYELKRRVLGLRRLHLYDVYAPLCAEHDTEYSYPEAVAEVLASVLPLGKEYTEVLRAGLTERRWVDVYPGKGKRSGAYSAGSYDTEPYILMNFMGRTDDVSTLAHEAGHSMHSYLSRKGNPPETADYTIFVAEVASTVNELLFLRRRLRAASDRRERMSLLNRLMELYKGTLYRQTMFAEFELRMHTLTQEGVPLTAELLMKEYYALVQAYFGDGVEIDRDIELEFLRIPHFYSCFYVWKYATCISAASTIVKRLEEDAEYAKEYLTFLQAGGSRSPLDSLALAGIDMRDPEVIRSAIADFSALVTEFRTLYEQGD